MNPGSLRSTLSARERRKVFQGRGLSFLLSQVGSHSSRSWKKRLGSVSLDPRHAMLLWNIARAEGLSQRELADALDLPASRVVALVKTLETQGLLNRRTKAEDHRARALFLTRTGRVLIERIMTVAMDLEDQIGKGLARKERLVLVELLMKLATTQGLIAGVHPDL